MRLRPSPAPSGTRSRRKNLQGGGSVKRGRWLGAAGLTAILAGIFRICGAQEEYEIAPFRLTGIEGYVSIGYNSDEQRSSNLTGGLIAQSRQRLSELRGDVFVLTHSYVYHPEFLSMDIGAGPVLAWNAFSGDPASRDDTTLNYNLTSRLNFLREKPYPFSLFYDHLNPTVAIGPAETLLLETTKYGANFALLQPLTPAPINLEAVRYQTKGEGLQRTVDDRTTQLNGRAFYSYGSQSYSQLVVQSLRQDSRSGSVGLPIQTTTVDNNSVSLDSRLVLGAKDQFDLSNLITYSKQDTDIQGAAPFPSIEDARFFANLRWTHSEALESYYRVDLSSTDQQIQKTTGHTGAAGLTYRVDPEWRTRFELREVGSDTDPGSSLRSYGANGTVDYRKEFSLGTLGLGYDVLYTSTRQEASAPQIAVIGERLTLAGTAPVALAQRNVIIGSVVVSNLTRNQTFVEGLDYLLTVVGDVTRVQRLVGGNIFDGQEVLVDYTHQTQGTISFTTWFHNANAYFRLLRYYELYLRYRNVSNNLQSGTPTFPLNDIDSVLAGARADQPLKWGLLVGGYAEWEKQHETISPFTRQAYEAYFEAPVPFGLSSGLRVTGRRQLIDFDKFPDQNVDLVGYDLRLWTRLAGGLNVSADYTDERDSGGTLPRTRKYGTLRADWPVRQLTLSLEGSRVEETIGSSQTRRTTIRALLRRDF